MDKTNKLGCKISENMKRHSERYAIVTGARALTYCELENETQRICNIFTKLGVKEGDSACIMCEDAILNISLIIACIYYKVVFIPIDVCLQAEEIQQYVNASNAKWIIFSEKEQVEMVNYKKVFTEDYIKICVNEKNDTLYFEKEMEACYIYFTSGSTGIPKGVVGKSNSLLQFIEWEIMEFNINCTCKCSQLTPIMFDPYLRDILVPLCSGGSICIPEKSAKRKIDRLAQWLLSHEITMIHIVPSLYRQLIYYVVGNTFLQYIFLAGEKVLGIDVSLFYSLNMDNIELVNLYGPTETTLAKFYHRITREDVGKDNVPVGSAIDQKTYCIIKDVIDVEYSAKEVGEIYISTPYATIGYLVDHKLVRDIFFIDEKCMGNYIYPTGDIGELDDNGELVIVGRCDNQIKVNGKKIQIEKIEERIRKKFNGINLAIVCIGEKNKILFLLIEASRMELVEDIKKYAETILSYFKVPIKVFVVDAIPYNRNGKVDRLVAKELCLQSLSTKNETEYDSFTKDFLNVLMVSLEDNILCPSVDGKIIDYFDSLSYIQFLVRLEEEYHLEFEDDLLDIAYFGTILDVVQYVKKMVDK